MTLCLSSCASETDIMRCTMCSQIIKKTCVTDCPFKKYFGDQNKETLRKIRDHCTLKLMREILTDDYPTDEIKERVIEGWYGCVNKEGSQTMPCETCKALPEVHSAAKILSKMKMGVQ